jgi:hypothetical protein
MQKTEPSDSDRLAVIERVVLDMEKRLFGNGQPGVIDQLNKRVLSLENFRWWVLGLGVGTGVACGFGISKMLEAMIR